MRALRLWATVVALLVVALLADSMILAATGGTRLLDPYLILTVWYGAHGRKADGMLVGALAGLVQDTLDSVVLGTHLLSKVVVGYAVTHANARLIQGQVVTHAVLLAGATVLEVAVLFATGLLLGQHFDQRTPLELLLATGINAVAGALLYSFVEQARRRRVRTVHGARLR